MPDRAAPGSATGWFLNVPRWVAAATAAVVAVAAAVAVAAPPADAAGGPCPDANGVTVVVDFGSFGGGVQVACAPGDPDSGYAALTAAGFLVEGAKRSAGFLCRINDRPVLDADPCEMPSPPWAYWSYWIADRGGSWCYSDAGMLGRNPVRGTVEGWSFVSGSGAAAIHAPASSTFSRLAGAGSTGRDCDIATTATTTPPATTARPSTPRPPTAGRVPSNGANPGTQGGSPGGSPGAGVPPPASASQQQPSNPGAPPDPEVAGATTIAPGSGDTTTSTVAPDTSSTTGVPVDDGDSSGSTGPDRGSSGDEEALSTVALAESGRSGPGSALGTGLGLGTITALGAAAVVVNRRRLRSPDGV